VRATHTYAILEVSASAYTEIRKLFVDAGYDHAFHDDAIDMRGIAIKAATSKPIELWSLCVECGPNVRTDEDGCCSTCGGTAIGTWLDASQGRETPAVSTLLDDLRARLHDAEAANAAIEIVEHVELNGHVDIVEQCHDWLAMERDIAGDPSGKLQDFVGSLRIVIDQLDRQRRQRNWYEVAYSAGKRKLIESAVEKRLESVRAAARAFVAQVDHLGAFVDDNDPRVMANAGPLGAAQADLWAALGLNHDEEHARMQADIASRCAVCGWPLAERAADGCVRGNCSYRPRPEKLYAPERADREERELALRNGMPPSGRWA
jgi:hypothetical protein